MRKRPPQEAEDPSVVMVLAEESPAVHDFPGNVVTPELIQELVSNGSLAPHFQRIHNVIHQAGWQARKQIQTEIEFGSVLAQIQAARQQMSEGGTVLPTPKHIPLLLRAFRKQVDNKAPPNGDAMRTTIQHALTVAQQSLEQWAPVTVMHVVRALSATGVAFQGPILYHQRVSSQSAMVDGQQQLVAFRERTTIPAEGDLCNTVNWKVKYTVPIAYPGNQSDTVQIAWELEEKPGLKRMGDLVQDAQVRGLLIPEAVAAGVVHQNTYIKLQWSTPSQHPMWDIYIHMGFVVPNSLCEAEKLRDRVWQTPRPRLPGDVPMWLARMGGTTADWRIEVELRPPYSTHSITHGLFLHHLIHQTVMPQSPCLPRGQFVTLYKKYLSPEVPPNTGWFARQILTAFCRDHDIPYHFKTGYPVQPRPHDLVPRDMSKLSECLATPKADGREAFLVVHCCGYGVVLRDGTSIVGEWQEQSYTVFPAILEGEWMPDGSFLAYDCLMTPVANYTKKGRYFTRHMAAMSMARRLRNAGCPCVCKPIFCVGLYPHRAMEQCVQWAKDSNVPCDGIVFASNTASGYTSISRLWKVKHVPTIDFSVHPASADLYELMLRSTQGVVQSLHRFQDDRFEYTLPVLLQAPVGVELRDGDVVELGIQVERDLFKNTARVSFPTMHIRETGKSPNQAAFQKGMGLIL